MVQISVIIPVYNTEKYINDTLDSVLGQTFNDFEIICVNDGSSDNSLKILKQYANKDQRIKVFDQANSGVSKTRNYAFEHANGKYIYYLDSDDVIHPQLLEICYNMAEKHQADVLSFGYESFSDNQSPVFEKINENEISLFKVDNFVSKITARGEIKINYNIWSKFFRKDILKDIKFDEDINLAEDVLHTFSVAKKNPKTFIFNTKLYKYRICKTSLSHGGYNVKQIISYSKCVKSIVDMFSDDEKCLELLKTDFIPNILKHQIGRCRRAIKEKRPLMRHEFLKELNFLSKLNMLNKKYHKKKMWKFISLILEEKIFKLSFFGITLLSINLDNEIKFGK